jgi:hypothetical protein
MLPPMKGSSSTSPDTLLGKGQGASSTRPGDFGHEATVPASSTSAMSGMVIQDRYRLDVPLARGGMSVLYQATQLLLGRTVAVKIMTAPVPVSDDSELEQRFLREARAAAQLRHPNSIVVHDYGRTENGHYFIAMEYLQGRDLWRAIVEDGPFPPARAKHIALQICESLIEAHALGIVHRDIKPQNVFLSHVGGQPDHVKVLDFGLAKLLGDANAQQTRAGLIMGTPAYMSPEQVLGEPIDARSDIYSFGALLFHMLAGNAPFGTKGDYSVMEAHLNNAVPSLRSVYRGCRASPQIEAVIRRCMAKDPAARYESMREVVDALVASPAEMCSPVGWRRVAGVAVAAGALGAVLLGVLGLPGDSDGPDVDRGASSRAQQVAVTKVAAPAGPSTEPAAVAPLPLAAAGAAIAPSGEPSGEPSGAGEPATAGQPSGAGALAAAEPPTEGAAEPPTEGAAEQPADTPATAAATADLTPPPRVRGTQRRAGPRRRAQPDPRGTPGKPDQPAVKPPPDKREQPAARPPNDDRPGPAVRRNPDPWAE